VPFKISDDFHIRIANTYALKNCKENREKKEEG